MKLWKVFFFVMLISLCCGLASATTLEVGDGYTYSTVNSALDAATNGDTILVHPGTYDERLDIENIHDLTLQGVGLPTITNADPSFYGVITIGGQTLNFTENAYNITISGLHIINTNNTSLLASAIKTSHSKTHGLTIEDSIINTGRGHALCLNPYGTGSNLFYDTCNDTVINNNTITTYADGAAIAIPVSPINLTVTNNKVSAVSREYMVSGGLLSGGPYGIKIVWADANKLGEVNRATNVIVSNNTVYQCGYSLLKIFATNVTAENNVAYGNCVHNNYELGFRGGVFKNNTLYNASRTWSRLNPSAASQAWENFFNPGCTNDSYMVYYDVHNVNSSTDNQLSVGGHQHNILVKNTSIDCPLNPNPNIKIYGFSGSGSYFRSSDKLIFDNFTSINATSAIFVDNAGTDLTPTSHATGNYSDILRDNITLYNFKVMNCSSTNILVLGLSGSDCNVSLYLVNSNLTSGYTPYSGGGIISSLERYYQTDINVTENGSPAGVCRIYAQSNATRHWYNESVPWVTGNYEDPTQSNYTYQMTAKGQLDQPEYINTLSDGTTGTRSTPNNCIYLAASTESLSTPTTSSNKIISNVSYNISVSGGSFNIPYFYTTYTGTYDIVNVDSNGNYEHKYGPKYGSVDSFRTNSTMYKTNPYVRGTVDLTIPITEYDKTIIPMGVSL